jgi:hypothetical protein
MTSLRILRTRKIRTRKDGAQPDRSTHPFLRPPEARRNDFDKTDRSATCGNFGSLRKMISENQSNPPAASKLFKFKLSHRPSASWNPTEVPPTPVPAKSPSLATLYIPKRPLSLKSRLFQKLISKWHCNSLENSEERRTDRTDPLLSRSI